jgi:hypothetical protein
MTLKKKRLLPQEKLDKFIVQNSAYVTLKVPKNEIYDGSDFHDF